MEFKGGILSLVQYSVASYPVSPVSGCLCREKRPQACELGRASLPGARGHT